jgi:hypothetical protein
VIKVEKPAQPLSAAHGASTARWRTANDQFVSKSLMVPFVMVVRDILTNRSSQVALAQRNQPVQALELDGPNEAFGMRVPVRRADGRLDASLARPGASVSIG